MLERNGGNETVVRVADGEALLETARPMSIQTDESTSDISAFCAQVGLAREWEAG